MRPIPFILGAGLALSLGWVGLAASSNPDRNDERRIERSMRGKVDKDTEQMEREERKLEEQPGGAGEDKYRRREQREAAKRERELQKLSNQVVKVKKHSTNTIPPP